MTDTSPILSLPYIAPAQAQKHVTHNEALQRLDAVVQLRVQAFDATIPPAAPEAGEVYATGIGSTGDWAGQDQTLAAYANGAWAFIAPLEGWLATEASCGDLKVWQPGGWVPVIPPLDNLDGVGIQTVADPTNRLSVASPASLFSHDGAGHQIKVNKAASGDTASLLYQSNWSGRVEMGLAGDDNFSIKVSPDGSAWQTALKVDASTGAIGIGPGAGTSHQLTVAAPLAPTILVHNTGGVGGASFRMIDDLSGSDWKFKTTSSGSFKLRDETSGVDQLTLHHATNCAEFAGAVRPEGYSVASLPLASDVGPGAIAYVTNEAGGAVPAFSDGTNWRRMTDRAVVS